MSGEERKMNMTDGRTKWVDKTFQSRLYSKVRYRGGGCLKMVNWSNCYGNRWAGWRGGLGFWAGKISV